jgi:UDP-galactopyranose mutase
MDFDYIIVGSGLFGAVISRELTNAGKKCLILEKRNHIGGNVYSKNVEGINVHWYGPHIFHTKDRRIWDYVNHFCDFNHYRHMPLAYYDKALFSLPFNMHTFYEMWKTKTPSEAEETIAKQVAQSGICLPKNFEEQAIQSVGFDIYHKLIKGYTEKQWGRRANELPAAIFKRLLINYTFNNNYFDDAYQGIPIGGYNVLIEKLLEGIEVRTSVDFLMAKIYWQQRSNRVIYTGKIDEYYDYRYGSLEYRSLDFQHELINIRDYQGVAVMNYTDYNIPYTRVVEHKHFEFGKQAHTVITKEYPKNWAKDKEAFYPVNDYLNNQLYNKYKQLAETDNRILFGGRLGEYKYYDMDQIIGSALKKAKNLLSAS